MSLPNKLRFAFLFVCCCCCWGGGFFGCFFFFAVVGWLVGWLVGLLVCLFVFPLVLLLLLLFLSIKRDSGRQGQTTRQFNISTGRPNHIVSIFSPTLTRSVKTATHYQTLSYDGQTLTSPSDRVLCPIGI